MTDDTPAEPGPDAEAHHAEPDAEHHEAEAEVAAVRERLAGLDRRPVEGHVAVFEEADQRLRRALGAARPEE